MLAEHWIKNIASWVAAGSAACHAHLAVKHAWHNGTWHGKAAVLAWRLLMECMAAT